MISQLAQLWWFQLLSLHLADISPWAKWPKISGFAHFTLSEYDPNNSILLQSDSESHFLFLTRRTFVRIDNICAYSIMIVVSALSIYAVGLGKLFVLELYLRGGFNIIACSKDLKNEIDNTDFIISELVFWHSFLFSICYRQIYWNTLRLRTLFRYRNDVDFRLHLSNHLVHILSFHQKVLE